MRVLWCVNMEFPAVLRHLGLPQRGSGWWMVALAERLARRPDVELTIVNCGTKYERFTEISAEGVEYWLVPATRRELMGVGTRIRVAELAQRINTAGVDIVDIHGTENFYGLMTPTLHAPVTVTLQGVLADIQPRYFADLGPWRVLWRQVRGPADVRSAALLLYGYTSLSNRVRQEQHVFRCNSHFVGRTDWDRSCQERFSPGSNYHYCHRILRQEFAQRDWPPQRLHDQRLLTVTASPIYKGTHTLLQAVVRLAGRFPKLTLCVIGDVPHNGWGGYLRRLVRQHGLQERVEFLGYGSAGEIADQICSSSLFVAPSFIENECIALAEAMRCGMPCIASTAGGMDSTIEHEYDGLKFPPGDAEALAAGIVRLLSDEVLAQRLGEQARATTIKRHDPETVVRHTLDNYRAVIAASKREDLGAVISG